MKPILIKNISWNEKGILLLIISYILRLKKNTHIFVNNKRYTFLLKTIFPDFIFENVFIKTAFYININSEDKKGLCIKYSNDIIDNIQSDTFDIIPWFDNNNPMIGYLYKKNNKIDLRIIKNKIKELITIRNHSNICWDIRIENKIILEYMYRKYTLNLRYFLENNLNFYNDSHVSNLESEIYRTNSLLNVIKYNYDMLLLTKSNCINESDNILKPVPIQPPPSPDKLSSSPYKLTPPTETISTQTETITCDIAEYLKRLHSLTKDIILNCEVSRNILANKNIDIFKEIGPDEHILNYKQFIGFLEEREYI